MDIGNTVAFVEDKTYHFAVTIYRADDKIRVSTRL